MLMSNNLIMLFVMWFLTSLSLHKLLVYYPERSQAVIAAKQKFAVSRIGDIALIGAIFLTYKNFGTFEFDDLFKWIEKITLKYLESNQIEIIGFLFVLGSMTKSAQFPFHFWLPETMETPAPISALMHAGIINAGGFLIIRLSLMLQHAEWAHFTLTIVGAITGAFGAIVMITQNNINKKLAYSTISQMGLMMFTCGLGAYSIALFHIIAHSLYKAYSFLSTGYLVEESKKIKSFPFRQTGLIFILFYLIGLTLVWGGSFFSEGQYTIQLTYLAILFLGLAQNIRISQRRLNTEDLIFLILVLLNFLLSI